MSYFLKTSGNTRLAYDDNKRAAEITLIFVHGWGGCKEIWTEQLEAFSRDYRLISIDLAGHGESVGENHTGSIEKFAGDLVALVDHLSIDKIILIGHSMGGRIIACAATRLDDKVIGLCGAETYWDVSGKPVSDATEAFIGELKNNFESTSQSYLESMFIADITLAHVREAVIKSSRNADKNILSKSLAFALRNDAQLHTWLRNIKCPKATINSADWRKTNKEAARILGLEVLEIEDAGHYIMLEKPAQFNEQLSTLLAKWAMIIVRKKL